MEKVARVTKAQSGISPATQAPQTYIAMPETDDEYMRGYVSRTIAWIHKRHGIPPEFFDKLAAEDDWTFIIKIHAVLETCANQVLVAYFHKPQLQKVFARLDMTNPKIGKIAFFG